MRAWQPWLRIDPSGHANETDQGAAEQPDGGRNRHCCRCDLLEVYPSWKHPAAPLFRCPVSSVGICKYFHSEIKAQAISHEKPYQIQPFTNPFTAPFYSPGRFDRVCILMR